MLTKIESRDNMDDNKRVGEKIKQLRESYNLTQTKFGAKLGVGNATILCWEKGKSRVPAKQLKKIAKAFKMPADWFLKENEAEAIKPVSTIPEDKMPMGCRA